MEIFIDTADVREIREALAMGVLDGVTTNPSLVAKTGRPFREVIQEICELVKGPVSAECMTEKHEDLVSEGRELARIRDNLVVKVPLTTEGIKAVRSLADEGIRTNATLCFSPAQALLAAKAGATYVSPFVGRLDDVSQDGMAVVEQALRIFRNYGLKTKVLVASVRHPIHVVQAAMMGADVATLPFKVIADLCRHPLTDVGIQRFLDDWKKVPPSR